MSRDDARTVFSSHAGRVCATCQQPVARCRCRQRAGNAPGDAGDGVVRVRREVKGRRGKPVTTISGVDGDLRELASELKRRCGSGGSVKDGVIEIQGDHRDEVIPLLEARGLRVKRAGG